MKKYLFIIIVVALFAGCSKKNNPNPAAAKPALIGKWYLTTDTLTRYDNGVQTHQDVYMGNHTEYLQFNSDGSGLEGVDEGNSVIATVTFTYTFTSSTNQLVFNFPTQTLNGTSQTAYSATATVKTLAANNLVITFQSTQIISTTTVILDEIIYLTKS